MISISPQIALSPLGRLSFEDATGDFGDGSFAASPADGLGAATARALSTAFANSSAEGLLMLADASIDEALPAELVFWREWARRLFQALSQLGEDSLAELARSSASEVAPPPDDLALAALIAEAPPMRGLEYLTHDTLHRLWRELLELVCARAAADGGDLAAFVRAVNPWRHLLGRVTFHLAENKRDAARPFAFLATYAHRLSAKSRVQHLPLAEALKQYAAEKDQAKLAELLAPVRAAAAKSSVVQELLATRALFQPQALTIAAAHRFLRDVLLMEECGVVVRVPDWWKARKPTRPQVQVRIGENHASAVGLDGLLDFSIAVALDGESLTAAEQRQLLASAEGLVLLRGKWVEIDREQLQAALTHWQQLAREHTDGIRFLDGMRLLAGMPALGGDAMAVGNYATVAPGEWLRTTLERIREPNGVAGCEPGAMLAGVLRPYQADGVRWLWLMTQLGLGACLADDMGLGKTIQIIDLLLQLQVQVGTTKSRTAAARSGAMPSLLVVPASLIGNWKQELARFAPQLSACYAHHSEVDSATLDLLAKNATRALADVDIVVTTYTFVRKQDWVRETRWRLVVLDEAQAIKNAGSAQAKVVKQLHATARIVLTGTPVENQLGDLWSLFDFCNPGLLGSAQEFQRLVKRLEKQRDAGAYGALRRLVRPYILRRMKTDPNIVADLPEKTEMRADCSLSKKQAALYQRLVDDFARALEEAEAGIQRRGLVLAMLLRLKQVCNHPSQYLEQPEYAPAESGKFLRLAQLCQPIAERQEKVLVFTQFQALCEPLARFLNGVFGRFGSVLHGGVPVGKRQQLVRSFQEDERVPFFVISVKAGGTGLNLTAASHVVHFDRWWNPAVENQATDRAFRIGQKRNVVVHKFVCRGTLEERIDAMLRDKQELADQVLGAGGDLPLTEMSDRELLDFVTLNVSRATLED